jgi:glycosyltransferase involved in cell wall biosynthesis
MKYNCFIILSLLSLNAPLGLSAKNLVVTITSYNNSRWYQKNLDSVFSQTYKNYRVIYIDDCSTDNTANLVEQYIKEHNQEHRVTLIKNSTWQSQLANHYLAAHLCDDEEVIVNLDGDDWFAHERALEIINNTYESDPDTWVTYGHPIWHPEPKDKPTVREIPDNVIQTNSFRASHGKPGGLLLWNWWHPRTYYAWLFKKIKLQDLLLESSFKPLAPSPDSAIMYPILEMAGTHSRFIDDRSYVWNMKNPLSQWRRLDNKQFLINKLIRERKIYHPLTIPKFTKKDRTAPKADMLIFSQNNPIGCALFVESILKQFTNLNAIYILYEAENSDYSKQYKTLSKNSTGVTVYQVKPFKHHTPNALISKLLPKLQKYLVISDDQARITKPVDLAFCIKEVEKTRALGFYIGVNTEKEEKIPKHAPLPGETVAAWQFRYATDKWSLAYNKELTLYKKLTLTALLQKIKAKTIDEFFNALYAINKQQDLIGDKVGLFFRDPKVA